MGGGRGNPSRASVGWSTPGNPQYGFRNGYNDENYFMGTEANWQSAEWPEDGVFDYESRSGSRYIYTDEGVYRMSNHWGSGVATCDWYLDGDDISSFADRGGERVGFARWSDFKPLRKDIVVVYSHRITNPDGLAYEPATGKATMPYRSFAVTPGMMANGNVYTPYGSTKYDPFGFMDIEA